MNVIYPYVNTAGNNNSGSMNSSIRNFSIMKAFHLIVIRRRQLM